MSTPQRKPWHVREVRVSERNQGVLLTVDNAYTGKRCFWHCDFYSYRDPDHVRRMESFKGAVWHPGAREAFARVIRRARQDRGLGAVA